MDINPSWPRIGGFSVLPNGEMGVVWLSLEPEWDILRIHQAVKFDRPHIGIIASELRRHPWTPVAWANEEFAENLRREHKCRMLQHGIHETQEKAEELTNVIAERMETNRLRINSACTKWAEEFESFRRGVRTSQVPRDSHPLMAATRHAVAMLKYARPEAEARPPERLKRPQFRV